MPEAEERHIEISRKVRVYTVQAEGERRLVLIAAHGYRQLGKYFVKHFEPLSALGVQVVVPEGIHRFYIEGYAGRVGASWMTREDRNTDIADYVQYFLQLLNELKVDAETPIVLLGFSQGGATVCRWLEASPRPIQHLILHSSVFPDDFDFQGNTDLLMRTPCTAIFGDEDEFANEQTILQKMTWMKEQGVDPTWMRFEGGHVIHFPSIEAVIKRLVP
jgi:predicted esterase